MKRTMDLTTLDLTEAITEEFEVRFQALAFRVDEANDLTADADRAVHG